MDADTAIGGPSGRFPSTRLSLLEAAASGLSEAAMDQVIALYWKPVYRFLRVKFQKSNEDAKDLTQGFFASALQRDFFARFDPPRHRSEPIFAWRLSAVRPMNTPPEIVRSAVEAWNSSR